MSDQATAVAPEAVIGSAEKHKRPKHIGIREKIRAATILERLERNALGELDPPMSRDQIKSAEVVIRKVIPDLQAITINGDDDAPPVRVFNRIVLCGPDGRS